MNCTVSGVLLQQQKYGLRWPVLNSRFGCPIAPLHPCLEDQKAIKMVDELLLLLYPSLPMLTPSFWLSRPKTLQSPFFSLLCF